MGYLVSTLNNLVSEGNELLYRTLILLDACARNGIHTSLENPTSSRLFHHPRVLSWAKRNGIHKFRTHYCCWGKDYLKPTSIWSSLGVLSKIHRCCQGGHPHFELRGKDLGIFKTALAAPYPIPLCDAWSECVDTAYTNRNYNLDNENHNNNTLGNDKSTFDSTPADELQSYFSRVPDSLNEECEFEVLHVQKWGSPEAIHMLEARAALRAVEHVARTPEMKGTKHVMLNDNMAVVCAFSKGRCSNFWLLKCCRRLAAVVLQAGLYPSWRYIETARNLSDGPTRPDKLNSEGEKCKFQGDCINIRELKSDSKIYTERADARRWHL